ncbi:hypothetical protein SLNWT_4703 [Streptomyces albus]|uniref:Uncharacterized protein n=1 Tax=Streptomyces albus (strain ATCC 21838 / DSM 41398 / FERM P-419 / JCM 4703 / NBRC 107858) TaxID=1081613 RepID=A0A0B5ETQ8_STRA4|nr:hypothetical protein SLNWT_4703 [Streptomyces albus]AOU79386.1 hypothetical protein SLNHY_4695 [Streptomyces albus]AYN35113.1 hypothetical protein DUI70_4615 [Streptomyces albus]
MGVTATQEQAAGTAARTESGADWEELVTAALLGTERRTPPVGRTGGSPATALLDAAAVQTVRRRAGLRPAAAAAPLEAAGEDPRPAPPGEAVRRLSLLLTDRPGSGNGRRGSAPDLLELLPQWLSLANSLGYRAPSPLLPALLDAARGRSDLRAEVLAFTGVRGLWLARLNPDWKYALRATPGSGASLPAPEDAAEVTRLWEEGLFAERVALLAAGRRHDPAAARELLASTWASERAEDRLMFLDSLRTGLSAADEPFLEQALTDRSRNVRATAAELLSALPGSALAGRMAERAAACVRLESTAAGPRLLVEPPRECDAGMERDGVVRNRPAGRGERAWWLGQLVEAAPLAQWSGHFGGRSPREIVALEVADEWRDELHAAWCRAAVRQSDARWSRALLAEPGSPVADGPGAASLSERARLLGILPAAERAEWVAAFLPVHGLSEAFQLLGTCASPWAPGLGSAVVDALNIARDAGSYPWSFSGVLGLAERCLDPAEAGRLAPLAAIPDEAEDAAPGAGGYWAEAFQRLLGTLQLRAAMRTELLAGREPDRAGTAGSADTAGSAGTPDAGDPAGAGDAPGPAETPGAATAE